MNRNLSVRITAAVSLALAVTGCSGGGNGAPVMPGHSASAGKGTGAAVFVIKVPLQSSASSSGGAGSTSALRASAHHDHFDGVRPQYVSPATQSITVDITGPTNVNETANLTINSSGCTSTLASTVCTLTVSGLLPGNYTATLTTYDQTGGTGNVLSAAQAVTFTIVAGQSNQIALTLSGVPVTTLVLPADSTTLANASGGYDVLGQGAHKFVAESLDADGNIIVGPGSPLFTIGTPSGIAGMSTSPSTTTTSAPNAFTVTPPAAFVSGTASFTVAPTFAGQATDGCTQTGANCAPATVKVDMKYKTVALFVPNGGSNTVTEYAPPYTGAPAATISNSISGPAGVAFDSSGDLFVANINNTVTEYAPPYTSAPVATISNSISGPGALAFDSSGDLFVANVNGNDVTEYAAGNLTGAPTATISNAVNGPYGLAFNSSGNLFVANGPAGNVTEYAPPYTGAPVATISNSVVFPEGVAFDSSGDLFVANHNSNSVTEYAAGNLTGAPSATISNSISGPTGVAFDTSGDLFVADVGNNNVTEYAPPYTGAPVATISNSVNSPLRLGILEQP